MHQLSSEEVAQREVHHIDIANNAAVSRNVSWLFKIGVQLLKRKGLGGVEGGGGESRKGDQGNYVNNPSPPPHPLRQPFSR